MPSTSHDKPLTPEELKQIRKRAGLTLSQLARRFGLSDSSGKRTIRRYEAGERVPPDAILEQYHKLRNGKL